MKETWLDRKDRDANMFYTTGFAANGSDADLHVARPEVDDGKWQFDRTRSHRSGSTVSHFGDVTEPAIAFIKGSKAVVGCVAWMTSAPLLRALATVESAIVVQKEDFLRPDIETPSDWHTWLRKSYGSLGNTFSRYNFPSPFGMMSFGSDPSVDPVSCVGNHNSERKPAMPRMHHKFLVRIEIVNGEVVPQSVWTGSFNFSANGGRSFENAIEIHDPEVAKQYLDEFSIVASLSEPLNWQQKWVTPQYRVGS